MQCMCNVHVLVVVTARRIVRALYDYQPRQADDLGFKKGDKMEIIQSR